MIIRFLNPKGLVCEICSDTVPILLYATAEEKKTIAGMQEGACLTLISKEDDNYEETQSKLFHEKKPLLLI